MDTIATTLIKSQATQVPLLSSTESYEVHVMATQAGSFILARFEAWSDCLAQKIGGAYMEAYEKVTGDYIYRERLYRLVENGEPIELSI